MNTQTRCAIAVVAVLLLAGGLFAAQTSAASGFSLAVPTGSNQQGPSSPVLAAIPADNDVGVSWILPAPDVYMPYGDTFYPRCEVKNYGVQTQTNIPVVCVVYDTTAHARVYGPETAYVASLDSGSVDTVEFPAWLPPAEDRVYHDTMATALAGDEDPSNDWSHGRLTVTDWGDGHLSYNDGTFENAISWIYAGSEFTERFVAPERPLTVSKAQLWLTSFSGLDYDAEVRVYGNDGIGGCPGTQLGSWTGQLQTDTWMLFRRNDITFDPPIEVDYDTFFVSWYETSIDPHYPYVALDEVADTIDIGNDWGWLNKDGARTWGLFPLDDRYDFAIDAFYDAPMLDGSPKEIAAPQANIDSNTAVTPQVVVKNAGLCDRANIVTKFYIVSAARLGDTIYSGIANSGPIKAGQTKIVTFGESVTPEPGYYTMTSITLLPYDARHSNDTLVRPLAVGRLGIEGERAAVASASVAIAPNPTASVVAVRYSLPKAGLVTLDVYDASGRGVLSQTIAAERAGTATFDLRKLQAGVYVVKVRTDGYSTTQKLVVQR
jgi:hypothetical protein